MGMWHSFFKLKLHGVIKEIAPGYTSVSEKDWVQLRCVTKNSCYWILKV